MNRFILAFLLCAGVALGQPLVPPKATQTQAEEGTNNVAYMTPLRTAQALDGVGAAAVAAKEAAEAARDAAQAAEAGAVAIAAGDIYALRNALAPAGALAFDGTTGSKALVNLTGQSIGTDSCSINLVKQVPTGSSLGYNGPFVLGPASTTADKNNTLFFDYGSSGNDLRVILTGADAGGADGRVATIAGWRTAYAGKTVMLTFVRDSAAATFKIYVNAVDTAYTETTGGTPPTWAGSITSTYLVLGQRGNQPWRGKLYRASLYNLALSAADVLEIYELGGGVPERYKSGSQVNLSTEAFVTGDFSQTYDSFSGASATGFTAAHTTAGTQRASARPQKTSSEFSRRRVLRIDFDAILTSGQAPTLEVVNSSGANLGGAVVSSGANSVTIQFGETTGAVPTDTGNTPTFKSTAAAAYSVSNFRARLLGAIAHFDADAFGGHCGYQWHDSSTNKLDATITTTGCTWTNPSRRDFVRGTLTWAGTHEAKSLLGQRALPSEAVITQIARKATAGSSGSGCTIGTTNSATRWQAADTYTTAKELATLAAQLPAGTAAADTDIVVDPDTANFTGSITIEAHYVVTEGTP